jgi:hypothetical protein
MPGTIATTLLCLFVINLGIAFGAGLYESRIVVPRWIGLGPDGVLMHWNAEAAQQDDTGRRFWAFVTTGPLTLLTLANLFASWRTSGRLRRWWIGAAVTVLVERAFTFAYFIPTMVWLIQQEHSGAVAESASTWAQVNYVRHALVVIALVCALKALTMLYYDLGQRNVEIDKRASGRRPA